MIPALTVLGTAAQYRDPPKLADMGAMTDASDPEPERPLLPTIASVVGALSILVAVFGALLRTFGPATPQSFNIGSPLDFWLEAATTATYALVGVILVRRMPRHPVAWIFVIIGLVFGGVVFTWAWGVFALSSRPELGGAQIAAMINTVVLAPVGLGLVVPLLYVFPDGHPVDRRAGRIALLAPVAAVLIGIGVLLTPGSIGIYTGLDNPLDPKLSPTVGRGISVLGVLLIIALSTYGCWTLVRRYRRATTVERQQIRWFLWAGTVATVVVGAALLIYNAAPALLHTPYEPVIVGLFAFAAALIPIACAIAIVRHRLYDIDRIISRTFVYGFLVAALAGLYSAAITALERISVAITGQESDVSIVLTTLILAFSFEPIKRRLEALAGRFNDEPEARATPTTVEPDDVWVERVAQRVAQLLRERGEA